MGGGERERCRRRNGVLKRAAQKLFMTCASFSFSFSSSSPHLHSSSTTHPTPPPPPHLSNLCTICLDPLSYSTGTSPSKAIFTAQCSHAFHFACIASNVRHGGVTCPICRAQWTHLPRNLASTSLFANQTDDPILQILDDSIATFRVHRRSFLRSARYDDDDPIEPNPTPNHPRLRFSLLYEPPHSCLDQNSVCHLSVKLAHQPAKDLVLVASPNGSHLRLMKQSMGVVVYSLRPIDRLAIVTYAARVFPLRRMTSYGKRGALEVIERLFYMGDAGDPIEGLKKGVKVLGERAHENPESCILHLSDCPTTRRSNYHMEAAGIPIHRFHIGFSFGFEDFLERVLLGDAIRDIQLRIGEEGRIARLCEIRGGEETRIPVSVNMREPGQISVHYSYVQGRIDECITRGQLIVRSDVGVDVAIPSGGAAAGSWDYHDPFMARRWAKHLHGYRL